MSHTPRPWKATETKAFGLSEVIAPECDCAQGHLVCSVNQRGFIGGQERFLPRAQREANACLIAAAPDLLEACRDAVELLHADTETPIASLTNYERACLITRNNCLAAIAKTEPPLATTLASDPKKPTEPN